MLSKRLSAIANIFSPSESMCDVGSDHALLPIALLKSKKIQKAMIVEIAQGPLNKALKECQNELVLDRVQFYLSDGLSQVNEKVENVVIAGMGFDTIKNIILESINKFRDCNQIILQSNSKIQELRTFMNQLKFECLDEVYIEDNHKGYVILKYHYNIKMISLNEFECLCGPHLLNQKNLEYEQYLLKMYHRYLGYIKLNPSYQTMLDHLKLYLHSKGIL